MSGERKKIVFLFLCFINNKRGGVAYGVDAASFFGMESFPILNAGSDFVKVQFGQGVVNSVNLSLLSSGNPQLLNSLVKLLGDVAQQVVWEDEGEKEFCLIYMKSYE
jgi:hypothetical protein